MNTDTNTMLDIFKGFGHLSAGVGVMLMTLSDKKIREFGAIATVSGGIALFSSYALSAMEESVSHKMAENAQQMTQVVAARPIAAAKATSPALTVKS